MSDTTVFFTVGDIIRKLRKDRKWSIRKLAAESGIGRMTISAIERNESNYQKETLDAIASAFGLKSGAELEAMASVPATLTRRATDTDLAPDWVVFTRRVMRLNRQAQGVLQLMLLTLEDLGALRPDADGPTPAPDPHTPPHPLRLTPGTVPRT